MDKAALSPSVEAVPASRIREIADIAFSMDGVLKLYFGESDQPTPDYIKEAATRALADGYTFYTENAGLPSLRKALAEKYRGLHRVELDPNSEIVITSSGVQALNVGIRCALDPGDEALLLTPAWPNGSAIVQMFNGRPRQVPMALKGSRYEIDFDRLRSCLTPRTRLLLYTSPSNPLGWVASRQDQETLLEFCRRHRLWLLADEVYERLYYGGDVAPSILRLCDREDAVLVVQSFSKTYCMTGWRLGWLVTRRDAARKATRTERVRGLPCPGHGPKGRRSRSKGWRIGAEVDAGAVAGQPEFLPAGPQWDAGRHASRTPGSLLSFSPDRGVVRLVRVLPQISAPDASRICARRGLRGGRGGIGAALLRGRPGHPAGGLGEVENFPG